MPPASRPPETPDTGRVLRLMGGLPEQLQQLVLRSIATLNIALVDLRTGELSDEEQRRWQGVCDMTLEHTRDRISEMFTYHLNFRSRWDLRSLASDVVDELTSDVRSHLFDRSFSPDWRIVTSREQWRTVGNNDHPPPSPRSELVRLLEETLSQEHALNVA